MINICKDCEYTTLIADLIKTLDGFDRFELKIWINGCELPHMFDESCDFCFLQEGLRVSLWNTVEYIFYDLISAIEVRDRT
jgi:hypothetical protein